MDDMSLTLKAGTVLYSGCGRSAPSPIDIQKLKVVDSWWVATRYILTNRYYVVSKEFQDKIGGFKFHATNKNQCTNYEIKTLLEKHGFDFIATIKSDGITYTPMCDGKLTDVSAGMVVDLLVSKYDYQYDPSLTLKVYIDDDGNTLPFTSVNTGFLIEITLLHDMIMQRCDHEWVSKDSFELTSESLLHGAYRVSRINCGTAGFHYYHQMVFHKYSQNSFMFEVEEISASVFLPPMMPEDIEAAIRGNELNQDIQPDNVTYLYPNKPT
ncbi:hypothetical protein D3C80_176180 [compost metagenome]